MRWQMHVRSWLQKQEILFHKQLFEQTVLLHFSGGGGGTISVLLVMRILVQFSFVWFVLTRSSSFLASRG